MALDEALLERVGACPDTVFVRTYGWQEPTLSLGYFQRQSQALAESRWQSVPIVRRSTGGGAIWHDRELTYAVVLPADFPGAHPARALYRQVHQAIVGLLREERLDARRRADAADMPAPGASGVPQHPVLCFADADPEDIVACGFKVAGSAQRRRGKAILQHGSILLASSNRTPELRGVCDLAAVSSDPRDWSNKVALRIATALGVEPSLGDWPADVRRRALQLARTLYGDVLWTARR
jgi:lipoate-protein ligase A